MTCCSLLSKSEIFRKKILSKSGDFGSFFPQKSPLYEFHWNFLLMYSGENLPLKQNAGDMCLSLNTQSWSQSLHSLLPLARTHNIH